jgi:hypothetical protein
MLFSATGFPVFRSRAVVGTCNFLTAHALKRATTRYVSGILMSDEQGSNEDQVKIFFPENPGEPASCLALEPGIRPRRRKLS